MPLGSHSRVHSSAPRLPSQLPHTTPHCPTFFAASMPCPCFAASPQTHRLPSPQTHRLPSPQTHRLPLLLPAGVGVPRRRRQRLHVLPAAGACRSVLMCCGVCTSGCLCPTPACAPPPATGACRSVLMHSGAAVMTACAEQVRAPYVLPRVPHLASSVVSWRYLVDSMFFFICAGGGAGEPHRDQGLHGGAHGELS